MNAVKKRRSSVELIPLFSSLSSWITLRFQDSAEREIKHKKCKDRRLQFLRSLHFQPKSCNDTFCTLTPFLDALAQYSQLYNCATFETTGTSRVK